MVSTDELLKDLTDAQRDAVTHVDGPLLIVAGPGSGKTRVITRRVAYLIAQGIAGPSILAITFTNKAAGEMKERVSQSLGHRLRDFGKLDQRWPMICTFHSLCLRILRFYASQIGLPANFSIYDSADQTRVIKDALKTLEISSTNFSPGTMHSTISKAKNDLKSAEAFAAGAQDFYARQVGAASTPNTSSFSPPIMPWISTICFCARRWRCAIIRRFLTSFRSGFNTSASTNIRTPITYNMCWHMHWR